MRDFRGKESSQGIVSTSDEKQTDLKRAVAFLGKLEEQPAVKRRRTTKTAATIPRLATLDFLRGLERALEINTGKRFSDFDNEKFLSSSTPGENGNIVYPASSHLKPGVSPPILVITSDQQSTQTCGLSYLKHKLRLSVEHVPDPYHMMWNATQEALVKVGMGGSLQAALTVCNVAYGPWHRSSFFRDIQGAADELSADGDTESPLLLFWWRAICRDRRGTGIADEGKVARSDFLHSLPTSPAGSLKGPKASTSRFFSVIDAICFWEEHWHTKALLLTHISFKKGWAKHIDEILFPDRVAAQRVARVALAGAEATQDPLAADDPAVGDHQAATSLVPAPTPSATSSSSTTTTAASSSSSAASQAAPVPSKAKAYDLGRQQVNAQRAKAENTLHVVCRMLADPNLIEDLRRMCLVAKSFCKMYKRMAATMRSPAENVEEYARLAHRGYMAAFSDCIRSTTDLAELSRVGFIVSLDDGPLAVLDTASDNVSYEDARYGFFVRTMFNMLKAHAGNFLRYSDGSPFFLAGLLHPGAEERSRSMHFFQDMDSAFEVASQKTTTLIKDIIARSPFETTVMKWARKFAKATNFSMPSPQLLDLASALFEACGQSKIVEDSIGVLRDHEVRDSRNTQMALFESWSQPVLAEVIKSYRREEVQPQTGGATDKNFTAERLFYPTHRSDDASQDSVPLRGILGPQTWTTYNSQTCKNAIAEAQFVMYLWRTGQWEEAHSHWQAMLLPEFQVIRANEIDKEEKYYFVIKVFEAGAIVWPLVRVALDILSFDLSDGAALEWFFVLSTDNLMVQPTSTHSPLFFALKKWPLEGALRLSMEGQPAPLLDWQAQSGFAGVPEGVLSRLMDKHNVPKLPIEKSAGCDAKHSLIIALLAHFLPGLSKDQLVSLLLKGDLADHSHESGYLDDLTNDLVMDVVLAGDMKEATKFIKERQAARANRNARKVSVQSLVQRHLDEFEKAKVKQPAKRQVVQLSKKADADRLRYVSALDMKPLEVLFAWKPNAAKVSIDNREGRFRLTYPGVKGASFAWGGRGQKEAVKLALNQMWTWETTATGREPPAFLLESADAL